MADVKIDKLTITSSELGGHSVEAYFNPKEVGIDKTIKWKSHDAPKGDAPYQEFTSADPKGLNFELLFDGFEDDVDVYQDYVKSLERFVLVDGDKGRPPLCQVAWGMQQQIFQGVVASMNVKYTMFFPDGRPCRCTVNLKFSEASKVMSKEEAKDYEEEKKKQEQAGSTASSSNNNVNRSEASASGVDNPGTDGQGVPPGTNISR